MIHTLVYEKTGAPFIGALLSPSIGTEEEMFIAKDKVRIGDHLKVVPLTKELYHKTLTEFNNIVSRKRDIILKAYNSIT